MIDVRPTSVELVHEQDSRRGERGSAMLLAILVSVILTLLGVSFLLMAQTENLIAQNELLASQALYAAESGARSVKRWFDRPGALLPVDFPSEAEVDRSLRIIDLDGAGPGTPVAAPAGQLYKEGIDLDGDSDDDLFRPPYRGSTQNTLLGTEAGPDMRIVDATFLEGLSRKLFAGFPDEDSGIVARITAVDIYAPPYLETVGGWARFGIATVKVTARILDDGKILAERTVRAVLNETPYPGPYGALHSGKELTFMTAAGSPSVYWGALTAQGNATVSAYPQSLPRHPGGLPQLDPVWGFSEPLADYVGLLPAGQDLGDPWARVLAEGTVNATVPPMSAWGAWDQSNPGTLPGAFIDSSGVQAEQFVLSPLYEYETWKTIATEGGTNVRYFAHAGGQNFRENGRGPARSFRAWTHGMRGVYFFDTTDGRPPESDASNLTPAIVINGGTWGFQGVLYLNATSFQATGSVQGFDTDYVAPGEPFEDLDHDGVYDIGEAHVDLAYPSVLGGTIRPGTNNGRDAASPTAITDRASLHGILYTNGKFEATGVSRHYGSIIAQRGVVQDAGAVGTPEIYFDASIVDGWPPEGWGLPRVVITRWLTDS